MRKGVLGLVVVLAATAALVAATHASARAACTAGTHKSGGVTYRTFCGPASAKLKVGGKTYSFKGGDCEPSGSTWSINIGTITLGSSKPKYDYFGIALFHKKVGTNKNGIVSWQLKSGGRGSLTKAVVTLSSGYKSGTFSGPVLMGSGKGTGSFNCG